MGNGNLALILDGIRSYVDDAATYRSMSVATSVWGGRFGTGTISGESLEKRMEEFLGEDEEEGDSSDSETPPPGPVFGGFGAPRGIDTSKLTRSFHDISFWEVQYQFRGSRKINTRFG